MNKINPSDIFEYLEGVENRMIEMEKNSKPAERKKEKENKK